MNSSMRLVADTDFPAKCIAEMIGFTSRSAFNRAFETKTGRPTCAFPNLDVSL